MRRYLLPAALAINATLSAQAPPTNNQVQYSANFSNLQFGKSFTVHYTMPPTIQQILNIDSNITVQADTDILISNINSNNFTAYVTPFSFTPYTMTSFLVTALDTNGDTNIFYTPGFIIPISNEAPTNIQLADIEKPYFVWDPLWTILLCFVGLVIGLIVFLSGRKKQQLVPAAPKEIIDPFRQMTKKLQELDARKNNLTEESYKEFFVELSETVREFLSLTIIPLALESPTKELLDTLKQHKTNKEIIETVGFIMKSTDRAKYAKHIFSQDRIDHVMQEAFRLAALVPQTEEYHEL